MTDDNGYFRVTGLENPIDITEWSRPDIYVEVHASNWVTEVHDNPTWWGGSVYRFRTHVSNDIWDGDLINFGECTCPSTQNRVWDIFQAMQVGYWFMVNMVGKTPPKIRSYYNDLLQGNTAFYQGAGMGDQHGILARVPDFIMDLYSLEALFWSASGIHFKTGSDSHDTTTINVPVCTQHPATISLTPSSQSISVTGGSASYTLAITNNDSAACAPRSRIFTIGDSNTTDFNTSSLCAQALTTSLAPGASTTFPNCLGVNARPTATTGTNITSVTEPGVVYPQFFPNPWSVTTTINVVPCTAAAPTVSITPSTPQTITTNAGSINYTLSITNNDTAACTSTTFSLPVSNSTNTDFTVAASLGTVVLAPGANTTVPLPVTAVSGKTTGTTSTSVTATAGGHADGISNTVTTTINVVPCTPAAPSVSTTPTSPPNQTITTNAGSVN